MKPDLDFSTASEFIAHEKRLLDLFAVEVGPQIEETMKRYPCNYTLSDWRQQFGAFKAWNKKARGIERG